MQRKDEFMSVASHELKTPVTSMKAALQIIQRIGGHGEESDQMNSLIEMANKQVNKLTSLIEDLLDVTKIQSGKMELNKTDFAMHDLTMECIDEFAFDSVNHKIICKENASVIVNGDR
jgi:K+-sensing histidine kinase KdpD